MSTKRNHFNHHFFKVSNLVSEISEFIKIKNELNKIYEIQTDIYIKKGYINRNQARIIYKEFFRDEVEFSDLLQDIFKDLDFISINCIQSNYKIISNKYYLNDEIKEGLIDFYDEMKDKGYTLTELDSHKELIEKKFEEFNCNKDKKTKEYVKNILFDIFDKNKDKVIERFIQFNAKDQNDSNKLENIDVTNIIESNKNINNDLW